MCGCGECVVRRASTVRRARIMYGGVCAARVWCVGGCVEVFVS